jgi:peptidyl-dipeptidase Dcp
MRTRFIITASAAALMAACSPQAADETSGGEAGAEEAAAAVETMPVPNQGIAVGAEGEACAWLRDAVPAEFANPLLAEWSGPYDGVPQFGSASMDDLRDAATEGMAHNLAEIEAIANNPEPATFANTIAAMDCTGDGLGRAFSYWGIWASNMSTLQFRGIQRELAPQLSAFNSQITQNEALFARIRAVYEGEEFATLRPDQQRLTLLTYQGFARNGATLEGEEAARYAAIQQELATLHTQFANNVLNDEQSYVTYITEDQLSGLPASFVAASAAAAAERGREGEYAITNTRSSMAPFLTFSDERDLRQQVWETYYSRGDNGDEFDNNAIITQILQLRHERVQLLGYENYASWRLEDRMASNPDNAMELMMRVWPAAVARIEEEVADMQALADSRGDEITIAPWDYRYYAEKVRQDRYSVDAEEVAQYLQLDNLTEAMFYVAGELFGMEFTQITDGSVPVWQEDVTVYEVTDRESGDHIGLWYLDPFARQGKRSGAWASSFRGHTTYNGQTRPLSTNNSNFIAPAPGEPVLVSWDDATTFFHEFGHALHTLSSNSAYPGLNGGVRDYTEFQSQLLERWLFTQPVIDNYFTHVETGEPMPAELIQRLRDAANFNQGFATGEYLASALVDMLYHTTDPEGLDPDAFEREQTTALGMPDEIVLRHRSTHFGHIFSGEGYSAGYYGYMWADSLTADASEAFQEAEGGYYDAELAQRMVDYLFAPRNSIDPADAYRAFRGRDADPNALMRDRGFPVPDAE